MRVGEIPRATPKEVRRLDLMLESGHVPAEDLAKVTTVLDGHLEMAIPDRPFEFREGEEHVVSAERKDNQVLAYLVRRYGADRAADVVMNLKADSDFSDALFPGFSREEILVLAGVIETVLEDATCERRISTADGHIVLPCGHCVNREIYSDRIRFSLCAYCYDFDLFECECGIRADCHGICKICPENKDMYTIIEEHWKRSCER